MNFNYFYILLACIAKKLCSELTMARWEGTVVGRHCG
jgi:hypothetical protein